MWINVPLVGTRVRSSHPITTLNPEEVFVVSELKFSNGRLTDTDIGLTVFVRGENTCWFNINMITPE